MRAWITITVIAACASCATLPPTTEDPAQPETPMRDLCEDGKYHAALRALPRAMRQWEEYTKRTSETAEGAAGYEYATTMFTIAEMGDADWGRILDDSAIPYEYKVDLIFEILEARLGKGAVYVGNKDNLIVPRKRPADLEHEMIRLPDK
ncbi:MAG: hypothetical protein JXR40_13790 [Pontiellaceae bacterium]|nr:hypothetical protein [Pontiellaceae bacterium]